MTGIDDRLRSAMQGNDPADAGFEAARQTAWQTIESLVARRASRRRAGQRVALIAAVVLATVAMVGALTGVPGGRIDPADPPRPDEPADQGASTWPWLVDLSGWAVSALGLGLLILVVVSARHVLRQTAAHPERLIALAFALLGLGLPLWAYVTYVDSIGDLQSRSPDFATVEEVQVTSATRTWTPFAGPLDPLVSLALAPTDSVDEAAALARVDEVLIEAGFISSARSDIYYRVTYGNIAGSGEADSEEIDAGEAITGVAVNDAATVVTNEDGTVQVGFRLRGEPTKSWIPLAAFVGTFLIAGAALLLIGTGWARPFGVFTLAVTAAQVGLVVRGFSAARTLLMGVDRDSPVPSDQADLVSAATTDTYPLGLLAVVFLLAPWLLGAVTAFSGQKRTVAALVAFGVAAVIVIFIIFGSINGLVLEILE